MVVIIKVHKVTYWVRVLRKYQSPKKLHLWNPVILPTIRNPIPFAIMLTNTILFSETH